MKAGFPIAFLCLFSWVGLPLYAAVQWEVAGQPIATFEDTEILPATVRISKLNSRLKEIVSVLNPRNSWKVDLIPMYEIRREKETKETKDNKDPKSKPKEKKVKVLRSIVIQLEGMDLIEVTDAEVKAHNAESIEVLADAWARSLQELFQKLKARQFLAISLIAPEKLLFNGKTYILKPEPVPDRGLFRTTGKQVEGKIIFWEVPANDRTYVLDNKTLQEWEEAVRTTDRIFIFDRNLQFIPYFLENSSSIPSPAPKAFP